MALESEMIAKKVEQNLSERKLRKIETAELSNASI